MSNSRADILGNVGRSLGRGQPGDKGKDAVAARLGKHAANLVPKRAKLPPAKRVDLFVSMAEDVDATVARVKTLRSVPGAVADFLRAHNLPAGLRVAPDQSLEKVPWKQRPLLKIRRGKAEPQDTVSVTPAFAAIAETGTLMLLSGPASPTTLNFLPENHIVVLHADQVVGAYEEGWARLRDRQEDEPANGAMPRTVNLITGPSRSADIEQTLQLGAHGPRRLHIVLVDGGKET